MSVIQISVNLEKVPGKFLEISEILRTEMINIRAISVADTNNISTVHFVTDHPEKTASVLRSKGYALKETNVIAVEMPDHPGSLEAVLKPLKEAHLLEVAYHLSIVPKPIRRIIKAIGKKVTNHKMTKRYQ